MSLDEPLPDRLRAGDGAPVSAAGSATVARPARPRTAAVAELPLWRLHLMRVGYLIMGVGLAVVKWPLVIDYDQSMPLYEGVVAVLLTAVSLLALLGLRYPVRLLPILLFETLWKVIWLSVVALPAVLAGEVSRAMSEIIVNFTPEVIIVAITPWRYVWRQYVMAKGDRWH